MTHPQRSWWRILSSKGVLALHILRGIVTALAFVGIIVSWIVAGLAVQSAADGLQVSKAVAQGGLGILASFLAANLLLRLFDKN